MKTKEIIKLKKLLLLLPFTFISCERELQMEFCCDWDAINFNPTYLGHNVNQAYFTDSNLCNNDLCQYP